MNNDKFILDATASYRMMWFNKQHPNVLYIDQRAEVKPDEIQDFRHLPYPDEQFNLIVFDPPHLKWLGEKSIFKQKFGKLEKETWPDDIKKGSRELWRVLKPMGVLIFKWNDHDIPYKEVIKLFPTAPLFGQISAGSKGKGRNISHTFWFCFMKLPYGLTVFEPFTPPF